MKSLSEFDLAKLIAENPMRLDKSFGSLDLRFIRDPNEGQLDDAEAIKRKVTRLIYLIWSGIAKCLRNLVQIKQRAVEIAGLGVFGPVFAKRLRDPLDKGPENKSNILLPQPIFFVLNDDLL